MVVIQQFYRDCIIKNRKGIDRNTPLGIVIVKHVTEGIILTRIQIGEIIQGAAIVDADGNLADITTKFNTLLSYLRTSNIIAT